MRYQPRDYQSYAKNSIFEFLINTPDVNRHPLVVMPTGTGKSIVIADFLETLYKTWPGQRVLVLTHVKELIAQNYEKLMSMWPQAPAGICSAGLGRRDLTHPIVFGGIASVYKIIAQLGPRDLLLVDEAHLVNPSEGAEGQQEGELGMYRTVIACLRQTRPKMRVIGFTATPWKLGHGKITVDGLFTDICCDMIGIEPFNWLIAQGYLMRLIPKRTKMLLDTSGVHTRAGEFIAGELQNAVNKRSITIKAVEEALEAGADRRSWLVFCSGVEHAIDTAAIMNEMGIPAIAIHSKMTKAERDDGLRDFKSGKYRAAVNNNVLTTGFDHPHIDLIIVLRPTQSAVLWVQMLGRGTRPVFAPGFDITTLEGRCRAIEMGGKHNCLVLDFADNTRNLGCINDPKIPHRKGEGGGEAPSKECDVCNTWNHASARWCGGLPKEHLEFDPSNGCGFEFTFQLKLKQESSTQELIKGDMPVTKVFKIDHVTCMMHEKQGGSPMMKVTYYSGHKMFNDYIAPDHPHQVVRKKTRDWWKERTSLPLPETTDQILAIADTLPPPTHLRVWTNKKPYPQIMAACFDGTAFGQEENDGTIPTIHAEPPPPPKQASRTATERAIVGTLKHSNAINAAIEGALGKVKSAPPDWMDDDIPF